MPQSKVFLLIHGLGAHPYRWQWLKTFLVRQGQVVYTPFLPQDEISVQKYYDLITLELKKIRKIHPKQQIVLVGESLGGLICFNYAAQYPKKVDQVVLFSPAFGSRIKFKLVELFRIIFGIGNTVPAKFSPQMITRDKKVQNIIKSNKNEKRNFRPGFFRSILFEQIKAFGLVRKCKTPVLFQVSGKDYLVISLFSKLIYGLCSAKKKKLIEYKQSLHALSIEIDRNKIFKDMLNWIE